MTYRDLRFELMHQLSEDELDKDILVLIKGDEAWYPVTNFFVNTESNFLDFDQPYLEIE